MLAKQAFCLSYKRYKFFNSQIKLRNMETERKSTSICPVEVLDFEKGKVN
jgi:hypothetical protein